MTPQTFLTIARKYQAAGYRFDALLAWEIYQARLDKAAGVPCGKSWISRRKKCGKDKAAFAKQNRQADLAKTKERVKSEHRQKSYSKRGLTRPEIEAEEIRKGIKPDPKTEKAKGKAAKTVSKKTEAMQPQGQEPASKRFPLPKNHTISTDARITQAKLEAALDAIDSPGAQERVAMMRQIIANQGIQAVFNDDGNKSKNKHDQIWDRLEPVGFVGRNKAAIKRVEDGKEQTIANHLARVARLSSRPLTSAEEASAKKAATNAVNKTLRDLKKNIKNSKDAAGFTYEEGSFISVKTDSKERPTTMGIVTNETGEMERHENGGVKFGQVPNRRYFTDLKINPGDASKIVESAIKEANREKQKGAGQPSNPATYTLTGQGGDGSMTALTTYLHEMGHQVHYAAGKPSQPSGSQPLTRYSKTNSKEYFAEHFAAWVLDAEAYKAYDPVGAEFIENAVKSAVNAPRRIK